MHSKTRLPSLVVSMLALAVLTAPAHAVDGVVLINQSVAVNGTASPDDDPGFPVTISKAGSYRLSSNLTLPNLNTTAIEITASDVTLDLNGFAILGPTFCAAPPGGTCPRNGDGIRTTLGVDNVTVVNGTIRGMGRHAMALFGEGHRVERVHARTNGGVGISAGDAATVTGSTAINNGGDGITANAGSVVTGNTVRGNGARGIAAGTASTISGNAVSENDGAGIVANTGSIVIGNAASFNTGFGLALANTTGYSQNALVSNNGGSANPQVSLGINGGQNVCGTDAVCP